MRPLVYLTVRTILNGMRRAFSSARRLISLIFFLIYYFWIFVRPNARMDSQFSGGSLPFTMPSATVVEAFVFTGFAALTLLMMLGINTPRGQFRPADVDVLFPTPVSPKLVLVFRIIREYLFTLIFPFLMILFALRPTQAGIGILFSKDPSTAPYVFRSASLAWILLSLFWVCASYAVSLYVNRSDVNSGRNGKIFNWSLGIVVLGTLAYMFILLRGMQSADDFISVMHSPVLRSVFFSATLASGAVMGPISGSLGSMALYLGALVGLIALALVFAMRQVGWLYDQAASRGFDVQTRQTLARQGDMIGIMAERARSGKLKAGRDRWLHRIRTRGVGGIVWKELITGLRGSSISFYIVALVTIWLHVGPPLFIGKPGKLTGEVPYLIFSGMAVMIFSMSLAQMGFLEVLKRVDLQKPLPFSPTATLAAELGAKVLQVSVFNWFGALIAMAVRPELWQACLAAIILTPFGCAVISGAVLLMTVLFPDYDDPTQRGFRGLMTMLALLTAGGPCLGIFVLVRNFAPTLVAALVTAAVAAGVASALLLFAGRFYADFNPSD